MASEGTYVGRTLDRYLIIDRLGSGGVARVYRARHRLLDREVAIKLLTETYRENRQLRERLEREAIAVSRIKHPNIVAVEDVGETEDGTPFIVMELVQGPTLARLIESEGALPPARVAMIAMQILEGLSAAHEQGYVHRDLKPSNVIITDNAGRDRIKILDFGAVQVREAPRGDRLTSVGFTVGTPAYMAPEQILDPAVGPTADLYSLGIILYEMLTGQPPFRGKDMVEVLKQQMQKLPAPLPELGGLGPITMQLLEKRERERPRTAAAVLLSIAGLLDDLEVGESMTTRQTWPDTPDLSRTQEAEIVGPPPAIMPELTADDLCATQTLPPRPRSDSSAGLPPEILEGRPSTQPPTEAPDRFEEPKLPSNLRQRALDSDEAPDPKHDNFALLFGRK